MKKSINDSKEHIFVESLGDAKEVIKDAKNTVPPEKIIGYVNCDNRELVPNPKFSQK